MEPEIIADDFFDYLLVFLNPPDLDLGWALKPAFWRQFLPHQPEAKYEPD